MRRTSIPSKGLEWTTLALGGLLFCAAFLFGAVPAAAWNAAISGAVVVCLATSALYQYDRQTEYYNAGIGAWVILAPLVLGFQSSAIAAAAHVVLGLAIMTTTGLQLRAGRANAEMIPAPARILPKGGRPR